MSREDKIHSLEDNNIDKIIVVFREVRKNIKRGEYKSEITKQIEKWQMNIRNNLRYDETIE